MKKILLSTAILASSMFAAELTNTSYYVAYDSTDATQYVLVMPGASKIYTHKAGDIQNLSEKTTDFLTFPTYTNGQLCFSDTTSTDSVSQTMANKCYPVNYFYTQVGAATGGTAFILFNKGSGKIQEGLAGNSTSFKDVNEAGFTSIAGQDYTSFVFDVESGKAVTGADATDIVPPTYSDIPSPALN
jgi:hypothetical protein